MEHNIYPMRTGYISSLRYYEYITNDSYVRVVHKLFQFHRILHTTTIPIDDLTGGSKISFYLRVTLNDSI